MPFLVDVHIPESSPQHFEVREILASAGQYVGWNEPIAVLVGDNTAFRLICNMPVVVDEWKCVVGDNVLPCGLIASVQAEGDEIPYGRPVARIEIGQT